MSTTEPVVAFTPDQPNVDAIVSAAIRLVRLQDWRFRYCTTPPHIGTGEKAAELERNWLRIVKARSDLNDAVRSLATPTTSKSSF